MRKLLSGLFFGNLLAYSVGSSIGRVRYWRTAQSVPESTLSTDISLQTSGNGDEGPTPSFEVDQATGNNPLGGHEWHSDPSCAGSFKLFRANPKLPFTSPFEVTLNLSIGKVSQAPNISHVEETDLLGARCTNSLNTYALTLRLQADDRPPRYFGSIAPSLCPGPASFEEVTACTAAANEPLDVSTRRVADTRNAPYLLVESILSWTLTNVIHIEMGNVTLTKYRPYDPLIDGTGDEANDLIGCEGEKRLLDKPTVRQLLYFVYGTTLEKLVFVKIDQSP